jgi:hypothetical protein
MLYPAFPQAVQDVTGIGRFMGRILSLSMNRQADTESIGCTNLRNTSHSDSVPNRTVSGAVSSHDNSMRMVELTSKELCAVRCPTCGVAAGERCHLHSGSTCLEPHLDRKLCAIEALEQKRILGAKLHAASKYHRVKLH